MFFIIYWGQLYWNKYFCNIINSLNFNEVKILDVHSNVGAGLLNNCTVISPEKYIKRFKEAGCKVFPVVASVTMAKRMERFGIDGVIAEGMESGGHVGEATTMSLLPQMVKALKVPVIAAGGIASGSQMAAALAMGAKGIQIGTILLAFGVYSIIFILGFNLSKNIPCFFSNTKVISYFRLDK